MIKSYYNSLLFLLVSSGAFCQSAKTVSIVPNQPQDSVSQSQKINGISAVSNDQVFEKKITPAIQKAAPAIFYISNDQPVDRLTYLRNRHQAEVFTASKK